MGICVVVHISSIGHSSARVNSTSIDKMEAWLTVLT